jgi:uncharacterized circularly permuted ATP-grasp superfamily protein
MMISPYRCQYGFDELFGSDGLPRASGAGFVKRLATLAEGSLQQRQKVADLSLQNLGITFNVYSNNAGREKV